MFRERKNENRGRGHEKESGWMNKQPDRFDERDCWKLTATLH